MSFTGIFYLLMIYVVYLECVCLDLFEVPVRADGLKVEPSGAKVEAERVKRENAENILAEERDGMYICMICICMFTVYVFMCTSVYIKEILSLIQGGEMKTRVLGGGREKEMRGGE